jgi:hypothetical protein
VRRQLGDVLAVDEDLALGDLVAGVAHDRVRERRLAGAVRPHQRVQLAPAHDQVDAAQDLALLGAHVQVSDLELRLALCGYRLLRSGGDQVRWE